MLQDYLYSLKTVDEVLERYIEELKSKGSIDSTLHASALIAYKNIINDKQFLKEASDFFEKIYILLENEHPNLYFNISGRQKSLVSTERKILRYLNLGKSVDLIHDFFAFRIILFNSSSINVEEHCYKVMKQIIELAIKSGYTPCERLPLIDTADTETKNNFFSDFEYRHYIKDYICFPKKNGYQSIHLVLRDEKSRYFEIQTRTLDMHVHAESSPEANHHKYKENKYKISPLSLDREKISIYNYSYINDENNNELIFDFAGIEDPITIFQKQKNF